MRRVPPLPPVESCVFLDVDGTLVDFAPTPAEVRVDLELVGMLRGVRRKLDGALSLVSGRPVVDLDKLFHPLLLPAAGMHGLERRNALGEFHRGMAPVDALAPARVKLEAFVAERHGLILEDKQFALAVHFRRVPQAEDIVRVMLANAVSTLGAGFELLEGDKVIEIKPSSHNKATAVEAFMLEAPFAGRTPVFIGDDHTDRDGFAAVERHGGFAVAVGERVDARYKLDDPAAVRAWLASFVATTAA